MTKQTFVAIGRMSILGSTQSFDGFYQVTDKMRLTDVHTEIFATSDANGSFAKERTVAKIIGMTEMRTLLPLNF